MSRSRSDPERAHSPCVSWGATVPDVLFDTYDRFDDLMRILHGFADE